MPVLSVLDTSPIVSGSTARTALLNTLDLAVLADRLGYHRYWVPEHHGMRGVASAAPAVLIARLAAATSRIRVGAGGVLLPNHAPIVVAEQFGTLEAFHPGRIDLGIGRAAGGGPRAAAAVRADGERNAKPFADQLDELLGYLAADGTQAVHAVPAEGNTPAVWVLGTSASSGALAGARGLPYAFAHHLKPDAMPVALAAYRSAFRPSSLLERPKVLVSVAVVAAGTDERAEVLAWSAKRRFLARRQGKRILLPPAEEAAAYPYTDGDRALIDEQFAEVVVGSPATVVEGLRALQRRSGADELMIRTDVHDHADRRRSFELVAATWTRPR
ncbi:LLM class flavin-dependent oxidoreductase [Actinomycetes bacterium KLBMP 9759]